MTAVIDHVVFAGSYSPADQPGIRAFRLDGASHELREVGSWPGVANPSFLVVAPSGDRLYAVSETGGADGRPGQVHAFEIEWHDGIPDLTPLGAVDSGGDHPCHLGLDPLGRWITVSNYSSGSVTVIGLDGDGRLGTVRASLQLTGGSVHPDRQRGPHAHSATPTPDGRFVLVADLGGDRFLSLNTEDETLAGSGSAEVRRGAGPRHSAVRAGDGIVVVANELDTTVSAYRLDEWGGLTHLDTAGTLPADAPETIVAHVALSPDGRTVYVSNRGHDSIASRSLGDDGTFGELELRSCGGSWPRHFAVLPDGQHLLVANERSDELVLVDLGGVRVAAAPMPSPTCVVPHVPTGSSA